MIVDLSIFDLWRQPSDTSDQPLVVNLIQEFLSEYVEDDT